MRWKEVGGGGGMLVLVYGSFFQLPGSRDSEQKFMVKGD